MLGDGGAGCAGADHRPRPTYRKGPQPLRGYSPLARPGARQCQGRCAASLLGDLSTVGSPRPLEPRSRSNDTQSDEIIPKWRAASSWDWAEFFRNSGRLRAEFCSQAPGETTSTWRSPMGRAPRRCHAVSPPGAGQGQERCQRRPPPGPLEPLGRHVRWSAGSRQWAMEPEGVWRSGDAQPTSTFGNDDAHRYCLKRAVALCAGE